MSKTFITIGKTQNLKTIQEGIDYYLKQTDDICRNHSQYFAFTLFIDPGYYDEPFTLPENINIVGRDKHSVIIAVNTQYNQNDVLTDNTSNTLNLIELNHSNQLKNLTIQVSSLDDIHGIKTINVLYSQNKSNLLFDNILLIDNNTINCINLALNFVSIYGGTNNTIKYVDATLNGNYKKLVAIYCRQTQTTIQDTAINIYNESANNYCIFLELNTINNINIRNTILKIESGGNNYGILHNNSYSSINACSINIIGEEETFYNNAIKCISSTHNCCAKIATDSDKYDLTLEPALCSDINPIYENVLSVNNTNNTDEQINNYIVNLKPHQTTNSSELDNMDDDIDFIYYGFVEGQIIRGSVINKIKKKHTETIESNIYKIIDVSSYQLKLRKLNTGEYKKTSSLIESVDADCKIIKLDEIINIDIISSFFSTDICNINHHYQKRHNNCVQTFDPLNIYNIHLHKSTLQGGNLDGCFNSNIIIDTPQIIKIGKYNSHYQTLSEALLNVKDNNTYIFHISPGIYEEPHIINFKKNITIVGAGANSTIIKLNYSSANHHHKDNVSQNLHQSLINLDSNVTIKDVTFNLHYVNTLYNNNTNTNTNTNTNESRGITKHNLINCINKSDICFDNVNINVKLTTHENCSLIHFNKSSFILSNTRISLKVAKQPTIHPDSCYKINFINSHLSDGALNDCILSKGESILKNNLKEEQIEPSSTIVGIANHSSDLTLNTTSLNMVNYAFTTDMYYYKNYIMKVNDSIIILNELGIKSKNSIIKYEKKVERTDNNDNCGGTGDDIERSSLTENGHEGVIIFNNTQFNKPISDTYVYQDFLTIICNHCYLITDNSKLNYISLNRYGCLEEGDTNLIIGKISLVNTPKNTLGGCEYENTQNNIMIGNHLSGQIIGSNNIIVSNKKSNNTSQNKKILYGTRISNTLIVQGQAQSSMITGCLRSNMVSINKSELYNLDIHKSNNYTDNVMLNINGGVNASHYLNFSGSQNIRFKNHQHKNNVKKGMLLSIVEGNGSLEDVIHTSITGSKKDAKCIGVYLGETIVKITDVSPNITNKYDFMITYGKAEVCVINYLNSDDSSDDSDINIGDYLTSSDMCGYAIKQYDNICYNYTLCKALQPIRWDTIDNYLDINQNKYKITKIYCLLV
jgi:hypothetical protein